MPRGKTTTNKCNLCNKEISLFAFNRHVNSHSNIKSVAHNPAVAFVPTNCLYCGKIFNTKIGLGNHTTRCPKNLNRKIQTLTEDGRNRIRAASKAMPWNSDKKARHSASMKLAVKNNPESYTSSNRGRTKQIVVDGIKLQGQWEVDFYLWAKNKGLNPQRPTQGFKYIWNGERTYYPDFYIESLDLYVEVKGYETDRDRAKWSQFPKKLCIIKEKEIKEIRKGCFVGL
jgi:hypothetical protein